MKSYIKFIEENGYKEEEYLDYSTFITKLDKEDQKNLSKDLYANPFTNKLELKPKLSAYIRLANNKVQLIPAIEATLLYTDLPEEENTKGDKHHLDKFLLRKVATKLVLDLRYSW